MDEDEIEVFSTPVLYTDEVPDVDVFEAEVVMPLSGHRAAAITSTVPLGLDIDPDFWLGCFGAVVIGAVLLWRLVTQRSGRRRRTARRLSRSAAESKDVLADIESRFRLGSSSLSLQQLIFLDLEELQSRCEELAELVKQEGDGDTQRRIEKLVSSLSEQLASAQRSAGTAGNEWSHYELDALLESVGGLGEALPRIHSALCRARDLLEKRLILDSAYGPDGEAQDVLQRALERSPPPTLRELARAMAAYAESSSPGDEGSAELTERARALFKSLSEKEDAAKRAAVERRVARETENTGQLLEFATKLSSSTAPPSGLLIGSTASSNQGQARLIAGAGEDKGCSDDDGGHERGDQIIAASTSGSGASGAVVAADPNLALGLFVDFNNFRRQQEAELERELEAASRRRSELVEEARKEAKRSRERREEQRRDLLLGLEQVRAQRVSAEAAFCAACVGLRDRVVSLHGRAKDNQRWREQWLAFFSAAVALVAFALVSVRCALSPAWFLAQTRQLCLLLDDSCGGDRICPASASASTTTGTSLGVQLQQLGASASWLSGLLLQRLSSWSWLAAEAPQCVLKLCVRVGLPWLSAWPLRALGMQKWASWAVVLGAVWSLWQPLLSLSGRIGPVLGVVGGGWAAMWALAATDKRLATGGNLRSAALLLQTAWLILLAALQGCRAVTERASRGLRLGNYFTVSDAISTLAGLSTASTC